MYLAMRDCPGIVSVLYDWQTLIAGTMALAAGIGTIIETRRAAQKQILATNRQTEAVKEQNADLRQRHEDEFMPVCMLVPHGGGDPWYRRRDLVAFCESDPPDTRYAKFKLKCFLRNIGRGPALDINIALRLMDKAGRITEPWELSPLASGESRGMENEPLSVPIYFNDEFAYNDARDSIKVNSWQIILRYRNVFGTQFYSVHHSATIQGDKYYAPPHIAMRQAWVTFGKGDLP